MSNDHEATPLVLEQLATRYGISSRFENAYGRIVPVEPETVGRLLAAMGVHVGSDIEAEAELRAYDKLTAVRPLPASVVVVPRDGLAEVRVKNIELPVPLEWHIVLEDGGDMTGSFDWSINQTWETSEAIVLPLSDLPLGYHRLRLPQLGAETHLIVSPGQCWLPEKTERGHWGIAVQLYLLRSANNWGIGDFSDLRVLVQLAGAQGCALIGLNPLHQMFLDNPEAASPYSPATRLFLNPIYIDVEAIPEWANSSPAKDLATSAAFRERIEQCRDVRLVDYAGVTALKIEALRLVYATFMDSAAPDRSAAFAAFRAEKGDSLQRASLFQVLRQHFAKTDPDRIDWRRWPVELQTAGSEALAQFAAYHQAEVDFQDWLQFVADEQLEKVAAEARQQGMAVGLYRDLAVGCDASGAETWANPAAFLQRTLVGAPPDIFNPGGQNWGLPPFDPVALAAEGYRSFAQLIRSNMLHAGGIRIDHVMGLSRLYCIPEGNSSAHGAYVSFPLDDLIGVLALESQRQKCLVVGEDLGTVPPGFREKLAAANILSYRVLFFEQDFNTGIFLQPDAYPELAFANTGSHDLPTLLSWWMGSDLDLKHSLGLFGTDEEMKSQQERRDRERRSILSAFSKAGLLDEIPEPYDLSPERFAQYAHLYLAKTKSLLLSTQFDDVTGEVDPVNVPGTSTEHANWRRKYRLGLEQLAEHPQTWGLVAPFARL